MLSSEQLGDEGNRMEVGKIKRRIDDAIAEFHTVDMYLLENDLNERCIAARMSYHLQSHFQDHFVDVEYNRIGEIPKRLEIHEDCAKHFNKDGKAIVVPDVIIHHRGPEGPNLLVIEFKKLSNPKGTYCDQMRLKAFVEGIGYSYGALIECETRQENGPKLILRSLLERTGAV